MKRLTRIGEILLPYIAIGLVAYLIGSFISASFDLSIWETDLRELVVLIWFVVSTMLAVELEREGNMWGEKCCKSNTE